MDLNDTPFPELPEHLRHKQDLIRANITDVIVGLPLKEAAGVVVHAMVDCQELFNTLVSQIPPDDWL